MALIFAAPLWLPLILLPPLLLLFMKKMKAVRQSEHLLPPSPPGLPILGNLHQLSSLPHQSMWQLSKKYGPVMLLRLGQIPTLVISSAEAAREVLKVHDLAFCSRPLLSGTGRLTYNYLDIAFSPYNDHWRNMRKIVTLELFSLKKVQSFRFIREEEVGFLVNSLSESSALAAPVDLTQKKVYALVANITFRVAFGFDYRGTNFDRDRFHEVVHETEAVAGSISADEYIPYLGWIVDWLTGHRAKDGKSFPRHAIDNHLQPGRKKCHDDMIDVLLAIEKEQTEVGASQFTRDNIKAILMNLFLAGVDTSSLTVNWAMAELVRNPRVMKKVQDEVRKWVGKKGRVTEDDVHQLEYLRMVIKETLRLHPPGPLLIPRETMSHCKVSGYNIYPKTLVHVNVWAIGRDPRYWKDPEEFFPERFLDSSYDFNGQSFEYLPFGSGRRICPGIHMGSITVEIILSNLLYCFDWILPNGLQKEDINMEEKAGVSLAPCKKTPAHLMWTCGCGHAQEKPKRYCSITATVPGAF
uniref:Cytochrome P450 n=1 Tax=Salix viminalis TaxID=40686 RepID=A0A6N2NHB3_SALVM